MGVARFYPRPNREVKMIVICDYCGKEFDKKIAEIKKSQHNYCSRKCFGNARQGYQCLEETKLKIGKANKGKLAGKKNPNFGKGKKGSDNPNWKGGINIHSDGYIGIRKQGHPQCDIHGYVREHRYIMEKSLGRYLTRDEVVHHINGNKADNRLENLMLFSSKEEHSRYHILNKNN